MNWEAITAIGTVFTGLVILVTVIFARHELEQLRRATQLEGATAVFAELDSPRLIEAQRFVRDELVERMKDERFRNEVRFVGLMSEDQHKELIVLRFFERVGVYTNRGLLDHEVVYGLMSGRIRFAWTSLGNVVSIHRDALGPGLWTNFEGLDKDTSRWQNLHGVPSAPILEILKEYRASHSDEP